MAMSASGAGGAASAAVAAAAAAVAAVSFVGASAASNASNKFADLVYEATCKDIEEKPTVKVGALCVFACVCGLLACLVRRPVDLNACTNAIVPPPFPSFPTIPQRHAGQPSFSRQSV